MTMKATWVAAMAVALEGLPAAAFEGHYEAGSENYSQAMQIASDGSAGFMVELVVATPGCVGEFRGTAPRDADLLLVRTGDAGDRCVIAIRRSDAGLSVAEDMCLMWHGAACSFDGDYRPTAR